MAYTQSVIARATERLRQARQAHEEEQRQRIEKIYLDQPRLRQIDRELRATTARVMAAAFQQGQDPAQAIDRLREENLSLQREREWLLDTLGLEPDSLDETPLCETCGGSGYVGAVMCDCLKELCRQEQRRELSYLLSSGPDRFESFRLDLYSDAVSGSWPISPRENMRGVLQECKAYAKGFSRQSDSLLLAGSPGLGKTFLCACIARQAAESGWSVIYDTAVHVFSEFEAAKFGSSTDENRSRTDRYFACDLLILDDLGTELSTPFVVSALYTIINTRLMEGAPTIISTNLTNQDLQNRYSAQIFSRLMGTYRHYLLYGEDIRVKLSGK